MDQVPPAIPEDYVPIETDLQLLARDVHTEGTGQVEMGPSPLWPDGQIADQQPLYEPPLQPSDPGLGDTHDNLPEGPLGHPQDYAQEAYQNEVYQQAAYHSAEHVAGVVNDIPAFEHLTPPHAGQDLHNDQRGIRDLGYPPDPEHLQHVQQMQHQQPATPYWDIGNAVYSQDERLYQAPQDPQHPLYANPHQEALRARIQRATRNDRRKNGHHHQIQVVVPEQRADRDDSVRRMSESMQMMMMNQMMGQQLAAQQMQMAQMNSVLGMSVDPRNKKRAPVRRPSVKIKTKQGKPRPARQLPPVIAVPPAAPPPVSSLGTAAMENWQEATIVLCIAIVGVIYLIVSRTSKEQDKKDDSVARHLVPQ
ncbi:hypothetical protein DB88DRAFT_514425 [Papiliotrema laurentii]|uniref:Uncharacterized protein n=1 Tax=Papiliotrema laurentii TaxID=5418 RepID=A0AAD9FVH0_PAPLA|nr:hypothetical protein DB88DRAFT_514425 [Papiliotrema laurentii]